MSPRRALATALALHVAVRLLGLIALAVGGAATDMSARARLVRWDGQWYASIAAHGYGPDRLVPDGRTLSDLAFFPLFPFVERLVGSGTGLRYVDAGLLIAALASVVAACGIYVVAQRLYGVRAGAITVVVWAALPIGIVESMAYSEALFTAFAAWTVQALLDRRWLLAGLLATLAGLTRPVGVAVAAAVVVTAAVALARGERDRLRAVLGAAAAPLGWLGYVAWVAVRTDDPLGYFAVGREWGNGFDGGVTFGRWVGGFLTGAQPWLGLLLILAVAGLGALLVLSIRDRQPLPLLVYSAAMVFVAMTSSGFFGSKPRYLLPAFGLLLPVAVRLARARLVVIVTVLVVLTVGSAAYGAFWLLGSGPP
jgi:Dolichyl-phosphate-mannose-protein mannosyltransferase